MQTTTVVKIRPPKESDLSFIFATFSKSMRNESDLGRSTRNNIFFSGFQKVIDEILNNSSLFISCSNDDEDFIAGYLIRQNDSIHYIFVRPSCRRQGIAHKLVEQAFVGVDQPIEYSLHTSDSKRITKAHPQFIYNPFLLFKP